MSTTTTYSKATHFGVRNFLTIKQAVLEFDDTNVINLVGYNDSGKSTIVRAVEVLFYDKYKTEQVKMIHRGENSFEIFMMFDDGVRIGKVKQSDGLSIWTMTKNGEEIYTNKKGNKTIALDDVPQIIKQYLGVIVEPETKQQLNVRKNTDKLFLINTTGSENFKMITKIAGIDVLNRAVKNMNTDRNALMTKTSSMKTTLDVLERELETTELVQQQAIENLENAVNVVENLSKIESFLDYAKGYKEEMDTTIIYDKITPIDTTILDVFEQATLSLEQMHQQVPPVIQLMQTAQYDVLEATYQYYQNVQDSIPPHLPTVDTQVLTMFETLEHSLHDLTQPVPPQIKGVSVKELDILSEMQQDLERMNTIIAPTVTTISAGMLDKYTLFDTIYEDLLKLQKDQQESQLADSNYEQHMAKLYDIAKTTEIKICDNCGYLAT